MVQIPALQNIISVIKSLLFTQKVLGFLPIHWFKSPHLYCDAFIYIYTSLSMNQSVNLSVNQLMNQPVHFFSINNSIY